jgi:hypothetical protein
MPQHNTFRAFFSYAHHDAETDPGLISAFTRALENRVNAKLTNARFIIWRDKDGLRTGQQWNTRIAAELRGADVLIVLLTPRWVESDYCRNEYLIFEEIEQKREIGEYVAPILVRTLERQEKHFTLEQQEVYQRIKSRQCQVVIATEFIKMSDAEQMLIIDRIADDIEGMIERRPTTEKLPSGSQSVPARRPRSIFRAEFDGAAQNYEAVDFIRDAEVVLGRRNDDGERNVLAQIGFIERLYVQGLRGRIEFAVRRAFLAITNHGPGRLSKIDALKSGGSRKDARYVGLHEAPDAITVCMDPQNDKSALGELPLEPAPGENSLSQVAIASAEVLQEKMAAELIVSLDLDGLFLADEKDRMSPRVRAAVQAIINVAKAKVTDQLVNESGQLRRSLPIRER